MPSLCFPVVPRLRGQDSFPLLCLSGISSHTEYWPDLFFNSILNTVAQLPCKLVEMEGIMTQDLLSIRSVAHDLAGEMAEMEGVMLEDDVWKELSHAERIYCMARS